MGQEQDWDRRDDRQCVSGKRCLFAGPVVGDVTWDEGGFADDKKSEFPRIGIYAEESFRAECPRFALEGTSETRCFAIGFCKSTKQRQPSNARSAKRAVPY